MHEHGWPLNSKPPWLRAKIPRGEGYEATRAIIQRYRLHTVCESAQCPNLGECWSRRTATVMILGDICTRSCGFCAVKTGRPTELDWQEPDRVAEAVRLMNLKHVVITSVARDELKDGGAAVWAATIRSVRKRNPQTRIEVLIPDFKGNIDAWETVLQARPDILNHNVETVPRLHPQVRPQARYERSLALLSHAKTRGFTTKTGLMLGLGETRDEIDAVLRDLAFLHVDILTLGQYLRPSEAHLPMHRWVAPEEFAWWKEHALALGFSVVESGPLVRSSYHADEQSQRFYHLDVSSSPTFSNPA
ncbi:MAG: lipoyl synthase [Methylacidiphilales bacterium]|nr:lipoyl synthase [Candidatus Methylacidiphilales bacterium]MDW8349137.1 lipoyl synthase [Verrucomicrobiae bacterium]